MEAVITMPLNRLLGVVEMISDPDTDLCPPLPNPCWNQRGLTPVVAGDSVETECQNCWMTYLIDGI